MIRPHQASKFVTPVFTTNGSAMNGTGLGMILGFLFLMPRLDGFAAETISYNHDIRPILAEYCLECHGPDTNQRKGKLRLDSRETATESVIQPHHPEQSPFVERINATNPDERMPPPDTGKALSPEHIQLLEHWIREGAHYENHWAFEPIIDPTPPLGSDSSLSEIDRFLVTKLDRAGLQFSPPVNRQQLIRRATFDLTGLPPTQEDVEAFVYDVSPNAFEKVVDRLLDSPRYGERWGRHWLDIARYADTQGGAAIGFTRFPFSYTYRDYVIHAFNSDLPYNQFLQEQLAADQLERDATDPSLAGLGFLTIGQRFRNPNDTIDDQIDVVTRGLLGLTVSCARCHDHKYDPIPTADYYALYATLASSASPGKLPTVGTPPPSPEYTQYEAELAQREQNHRDMARDQTAVMRGRLRMQVGLYLREFAKGTPEQDLTAQFLSYRTDDLRPHILEAWRSYLKHLPLEDAVFAPWLQLSQAAPESFLERRDDLLVKMRSKNEKAKNDQPQHTFAAGTFPYNPRILESIETKQPSSLFELADVYGELFAEVHREWARALLEAAEEAIPGRKPVPDQSADHLVINSAINRELRRHLYGVGTPFAMSDAEGVRYLNRPIRDNVGGRAGAIRNLHLNSPGSPPRSMALAETKAPKPFHVMRRGDPLDRGPEVQAHFLTALSAATPTPFAAGKRRLGLAQAIIDPANPLTRRVVANWVWQHHFGVGLVRTPDDFGTRGRPPTHPKLLDYLASRLLEDNWSLKQLHRRIMLTQAYRQGAIENATARENDPDNELLWRMPRRRLDLEAMRDAMLATSGELDLKMGGRPFEYQANPVVPRRSVYAFVNRDIITPLASTFDAANPTSCTAQRPETNVPQQTLFALNSAFIQDRAKALLQVPAIANISDPAGRIRALYQRAFSRPPENHELETALRFIEQETSKNGKLAWERLAHALLAANEFVFVD